MYSLVITRLINFFLSHQRAEKLLDSVKVDLKDVASDVKDIEIGNQGNSILVKGKHFKYEDSNQMDVCCNYEFLILNAKCQKDVGCFSVIN